MKGTTTSPQVATGSPLDLTGALPVPFALTEAGEAAVAVADAAHYAIAVAALRQAANGPGDGRGAPGRAARRAVELGDALAAAVAQVTGELGTPGTPSELLADAHLRAIVHHIGEYVRAPGATVADRRRAVVMVQSIARSIGDTE